MKGGRRGSRRKRGRKRHAVGELRRRMRKTGKRQWKRILGQENGESSRCLGTMRRRCGKDRHTASHLAEVKLKRGNKEMAEEGRPVL